MKKEKKNVSLLRYFRMLSGVKMPWLLLAGSTGITLLSYYFSMNSTYLSGDIVDASGNPATEQVVQYAVYAILVAVMTAVSGIILTLASEKINLGLRQKMWKKMMYLPHTFYDKDKGETLVNRITAGCDNGSVIFSIIIGSLTMVYALILYIKQLFDTDTTMALYVLALLPMSAVAGWINGKVQYWLGSRSMARSGEATAYLVERTRNLNLIRSAGTQNTETELGNEAFRKQFRVQLADIGIYTVYSFISDSIIPVLGQAIILLGGGKLVMDGVLTSGDVLVFYSFSNMIAIYFSILFGYIGTVKGGIGSMDRIVEILEVETENIDAGVQADLPDTNIEVQNVRFGYGDKVVLDGVTCTIPKGKVTTVIGANGSGKSTLFKLLERFYAPEKGAILFGGRDVSQYSLRSWRRAIGYVPQSCAIMEGTLRSNITYGSDRAVSDEELREVARMANLTELVESLPDGFDSYVAPGGRNFSGGQRQCIAIARAIMRDPDYLLLDEATSALDTRSRRAVTAALQNLMKGRTTIMIAHDLASIRHADNVIVIRDGKVDACGSPDDIIKISELYRQFVMSENAAPAN